MAVKISALTAVTTPADTDEFAVNQSGTSKKETRAQIKTGAFDLDGSDLTLDADADTKIESATDDRVQVTVGAERALTVTLGKVEARSTDAGASAGPQLAILRDSASPAASDNIGYVNFIGMDAAGTPQQTNYAQIQAIINTTTDTAEDGKLSFRAMKAGTLTEMVNISQAGTEFAGGNVDFNAQIIEAHLGKVVTSVSGTLTTTAHSGNILVTSGNVEVPQTAGFNCTLIAGGAHTVTFNSTVSAAMASGDIMSVVVQSSTVIHAVKVAAADKVSFS